MHIHIHIFRHIYIHKRTYKPKIPHDQVLALLKQGFDQYSKPENEFLYLLSEVAQNSPKLLKLGTIQNLLHNLESSRFPKNLLKKFKEKKKSTLALIPLL